MRLFLALDIDDVIRERIARFVEGVRNFVPGARWVHPESLHVTLKFIGEQPESALLALKQTLSQVGVPACEIRFQGYGFFPTPKSARVFWIGMQAGPELATLAAAIDDKMPALGIPKEDRAFSPHLTLARGRGGSGSPRRRREDKPNRVFQLLQEKLAALPSPEFGTMTPREFFLYQSQLSPKGSKYTKLERFPLK
ncbi:MAG TPA: RNA 2',3'-cyclic phosphodiesterase [Candidatus Sulfotelmatobacter sp.]|nr:RNA 2',3'-cyclic phosphodiesterase [Candidatus Sulfotelmatobacter sp.]